MTGPARAGGPPADARGRALHAERLRLLVGVARALDGPMQLLGFVWLVLLVLDFTRGLSGFLRTLNLAIWGLFVLQFVVEFVIAPRKRQYLERHWLTAVSLLVPALRIFRILRAMRVLRLAAGGPGAQLVRVVGSINRGMAALRRTMGRRGIGFVSLLTLIVTFAGAAGMFTLERGAAGGGLPTYGSAVWWTSMIMTTLGSEYWPKTTAGRFLCILLALYAFAVFGYVTATLASFFIGRDAESDKGDVAGAKAVEALRREVAALRSEVRAALERSSAQ